ncbi:HAD family hydrolase [Chloroflexota bacterium]
MKYKAVIFDLDDTLFNRHGAQIKTSELIAEKLPHLFQHHPLETVTEAFLESDEMATIEFNAGVPSDGLRDKRSRNFLRLLGIDENYADKITEMYVKDYPTMNIPVAGAVPLIKAITKRVPVGLVSNGYPDVQYTKIEAIGLAKVFSCIILSEEFGIRKPDKRIFHQATRLLNVQPSDCLYVGDSYSHDIVGAKGAGMDACWINPSSLEPEKKNVQADFVITNLTKLNEILGL